MKTLAIIDDDVFFAQAVAAKMRTRGVEVIHFKSAQNFIDMVNPGKLDLILVDLMMADSSGLIWEYAGIEVISKIRQRHGDKIKMWLVTGHYNRKHFEVWQQ